MQWLPFVSYATGNNKLIAFDTNIAIYAVNNHPEFSEPSVKVIERAEALGCSLSVIMSTELLCFPRPGDHESIAQIEEFLQSFRNTSFTDYSVAIARQAAKILRQYRSLRLADAVHLATAVEAGVTEFWTNDQKLAKIQLPSTKIKLLSEIND